LSTMHQFLQQIDGTILFTDGKGFTQLAHKLGPVDLGLALSSYYTHVGGIIEKHGGRIVKFLGDGVFAAFLQHDDHRGKALAAVAEMAQHRAGWLADMAKVNMPAIDYTVGLSSGEILCGELGTDRIHFWDVIGAPVNVAARLGSLAHARDVANLVDADTVEGAKAKPACVEVEPAEIKGGNRHRLYRVGE
jgi:adenylate cyclase